MRNAHLLAVVVLAASVGGVAYAAEKNKIHIREAWYGLNSQEKVCKPNLSACEGKAKCLVPPKDYQCKTDAKPEERQLNIIWDCGELAHAAGHGAGPGTGKDTYTLTCPYVRGLNP